MDTNSRHSTSDESVPLPPLPAPNDSIITLQVGDRRFTTRSHTLTKESRFFTSLLSGKWGDKHSDGSYFIDSDPAVFEHVLRYLRSGVLPLYYQKDAGHDYGLYIAVLEQADFFGIERLQEWIKEKQYLEAVKIQRSARVLESAIDLCETTSADEEVEYHYLRKTEKVFVCPRGIHIHRGKPQSCGRQCRNAQSDTADVYVDEEVLKMVERREKVIFDHELCLGGRN